jgi:hypothetical protein
VEIFNAGRHRISNFCHILQVFLSRFLSIHEPKDFELCACACLELTTAEGSQPFPQARIHYLFYYEWVAAVSGPALNVGTVLLGALTGTVGPLLKRASEAIL